jgi:hypothetical protein
MEPSMRGPALGLKVQISDRINRQPDAVWTPVDFLDLGPRDAIDKALQRLVRSKSIRRIDRGLYDRPGFNALTGKPTNPDHRAIIDAVARRDRIRVLVDGMTAANDLGFTPAVPARIVVYTDARLRPIQLDNLKIHFRTAAPSRLHWAGHPAMRVVQALYWLKDTLPTNRGQIIRHLIATLKKAPNGSKIAQDLRQGLNAMPTWMQAIVRQVLSDAGITFDVNTDTQNDHDPNNKPHRASI